MPAPQRRGAACAGRCACGAVTARPPWRRSRLTAMPPSVPRAHSQKRLTPEFPFAGLRRPRGPCGGAGSGLVLTGARRPRGRLRLCIGSPGGPGGGG